ncbi:hypothetical protein AQ619_07185 [Caulobacter henricii]|uniref:Uncharacterized protein n=1 Tax=Caulobacter henricii TaxID=69395 RepID=A0A0P0NZ59_9CAUL|nr:hypothetical protein AQ619_07185 [Caulobacter henricii]
MSQLELFPMESRPASAEPTVPSVESIRARFESLFDRLRLADVMPLSARELAFWSVVTPQMSNWLPPDEKAAVCAEFEGHLLRLNAE